MAASSAAPLTVNKNLSEEQAKAAYLARLDAEKAADEAWLEAKKRAASGAAGVPSTSVDLNIFSSDVQRALRSFLNLGGTEVEVEMTKLKERISDLEAANAAFEKIGDQRIAELQGN